ncbi:unnamed protein product [Closterium sp. NIES-53]
MKGYAPIRESAEFPTFAEVLNLFKKRAALQQAQRHAWMQAQHDAYMASSARSPAAEEEDAWIVSSEDQEVPQAEAEEIAEEIYSLSMAAEGDGSENDSDPSSSCSNVAEMVGSEASSTTSGFSGSSCSGQSSNEEPSTAIAVNILCLGDYKLNRYNIYNKQYSDSALLLDLVLLLISFTVSKNVVAAVHLASRMGLLGADKSLVRGTPAARWRLLPTRRPRPGSKRVAGVQPAVVDKTMVTVSLGALQALKGCSAALGMRKQGGVGGVVFGDKKQPSRAFVVPSGGGVKQGSAAAQCKGQLERFRSLTFGACSTPSKPLDAPPAGCVKRGSSKRKQEQVGLAAAQSERKQQQVGSAASHNKRNQQQVGSAASHNKRNQQQVGSAASHNKRNQQQVGSAESHNKRNQQQVGSAASHNKRNQQQVGSAASHNKRNQQQVGSAASQNKRKEEQVGLAASQNKRKQEKAGLAASQNRRKQEQVGLAALQGKQQEQVGGVRVGGRIDPSRMTRAAAIRPPWRP